MNKVSQKSLRIVRGRPYSLEGGCIVYVVPPDPEVAGCRWRDDYFQLRESVWEDIIGYCGKIRGCIYPVLVLSADGRRLLRIRRLKGTLLLPEGVEEVADYAATAEDDNEISRIVWNGSIRRIGNCAFWGSVTNLVVFPPTVEFIGGDPFTCNYSVLCKHIVSSQCHCADTVNMKACATFHLCRYKDYRRFLDDMAWIEHICNGYGSVGEFVRDVRGLLENFDGDKQILKYVMELDGVEDFLSSYWNLRRLKEVDWQLAEFLCLDSCPKGELCNSFCMLLLEDDSIPRKERSEKARMVMMGVDYRSYENLAVYAQPTLPLISPALFHEEIWYASRKVLDEAWSFCVEYYRLRMDDWTLEYYRRASVNRRRALDSDLLAAIKDDSKSRFLMLLAIKGIAVKKTVVGALVAEKAFSCISAAYVQYPKMEKYLPMNDFVIAAIVKWRSDGIMRLIEAIEREMPGRIAQVKDSLGNNALWYLLMKEEADREGPCYTHEGQYRMGSENEKVAKRLIELGMNPFETTPTGLSWYEIAIGEDDTRNKVVVNPRIAFLSMLKERMMDMGESQGAP